MGHTRRDVSVSKAQDMSSLLNALASRGGGSRRDVAIIAKRSRQSSLAAAYGSAFVELRDDIVGMRINVPAAHGNKYGYATQGVIVSASRGSAPNRGRCLVRLDITNEERWLPTSIVRRWLVISAQDVERLSTELERATSVQPWLEPMTP